MPSVLFLLQLVPCLVNLSFSACAAWSFRKYPQPPAWVIVFLLILGVGSIRLLFFGAGFGITLITLPSAILCIVQAIALMLRRFFGTRRWKSWAIPMLIALPAMIWVDLRFSVLVTDAEGNPVEVDARQIQMQASYASFFSWGYCSFDDAYGKRLKKGIVYFGFCQWIKHRGKWTVWGDAISPEGETLRAQKINSNAEWGNWPLRITVDRKSP